MKLYVYSLDDNTHVATIIGDSNSSCEQRAEFDFSPNDFGWTYSPAFGSSDGLIESEDAEIINL